MDFSKVNIEDLFDTFLSNIYIYDSDGNLQWVNKSGMAICGVESRDFFRNKPLKEIHKMLNMDDETANAIIANNREVVETGQSFVFEETVIYDGAKRYYLSSKNPFYDNDGKIAGVIGVSVDITNRKVNQRLIAEKQQLTKTLNSLQMLAASMAHELRTPLVGSRSGVLALEKLFHKELDDHPEWQTPTIEKCETVLSNMKNQLEQALMFVELSLANFKVSKIDASSFAPLSMKAVVKEMMADYPFQPSERKIVKWDEEASDDFTFIGSMQLTKHVLYNLLRNATYYARSVRVGEVVVRVINDAEGHRITIRDTGPGISPDILPKIFDLFFTNRELGTGIGLSFCKMVMQEYKGSISCESVVGEYTVFTLKFPPC